jgi:hypothetical protein
MIEVLTSYVLLNGIYFVYTMSYVGNTMLFYWEVQHKLGYIWSRTIPTRQQAMSTVTLVDKSSQLIGNSYSVIQASKKMTKNRKISDDVKMTPRRSYWKWFCDQIDEIALARLKARQERKARADARLEAYRLRLEAEDDAKDQVHMEALGFARCKRCSYYTSPDALLEQVSVAALKCASDLKTFSAEDLQELQALILNADRRKARVPSDFKKFKAVFVCCEVPCKRCKTMHVKLHTPESICGLQQAKIDLLRENMALLKFEHDIVA